MKRLSGGDLRRSALAGLLVLSTILSGSILPSSGAAAPGTVSRPAVHPAASSSKFVPGVLLVKRKAGVATTTLTAQSGVNAIDRSIPDLGVERITVTKGQELAIARQLQDRGLVEYAEPDYLRHTADVVPNDPYYVADQWDLPQISMPLAWESTLGSSSVVVADIDTGYDLGHPDKPINLIQGPVYTSGSAPFDGCPAETSVNDDDGHGTHTGGTIAASFNNGTGVASVAPDVSLMVIKAGDCVGDFADSDIASALDYAANDGAKVVNMSFGGPSASSTLSDAVSYAWSKGLVLVAAAGNDGQVPCPNSNGCANGFFAPADLPNVIAVAADNGANEPAYYSNWGSAVTVTAPGGDEFADPGVWSTFSPDSLDPYMPTSCQGQLYCNLIGTSMATPHVAAEAGLLLSLSPGLSNAQVVSTITRAVDPLQNVPSGEYFGSGRINVCTAIRELSSPPSSSPPLTPTAGGSVRAYLPLIVNDFC